MSIKFTNFCKTNRNAPLYVKLEVLDKCVSSALIYGCETWGNCLKDVELCYRSGLKTALNVRVNLNNEIVYIEAGKWPLCAQIKRAQLKFWLYVNEYILEYPESALAKVLIIGNNNNVAELKCYKDLQAEFVDPISCQKSIEKFFFDNYKSKMFSETCAKSANYYGIRT